MSSLLFRWVLTLSLGAGAVSAAGAVPIINATTNNGSFELPVTGNVVYLSTVGGNTNNSWTYTTPGVGGSGVSRNQVGAFQANAAVPDGVQYAFLQNTASISQSFNLATVSVLDLSFELAGRTSGGGFDGDTNFTALLDGLAFPGLIGTTSDSGFTTFTASGLFAAGLHTLSFSIATGTDSTALLDNVILDATATPELNGSAAALPFCLMAGLLGLVSSRRRADSVSG